MQPMDCKMKTRFGVFEGENAGIRVIALEGLNGVGKSTLAKAYAGRHPDIAAGYSASDIFLKDDKLKKYTLFEADPVTSALFYLSANADSCRRLRMNPPVSRRVLLDRSVWSTVAAAYAKDPDILPTLMDVVFSMRRHLVIPDVVVVLKAPYETCQSRIETKKSGAEFDADTRLAFSRKYELYDILKDSGFDVRFLNTDGKAPCEVLSEFESLDLW